jgi:hypothetical protein
MEAIISSPSPCHYKIEHRSHLACPTTLPILGLGTVQSSSSGLGAVQSSSLCTNSKAKTPYSYDLQGNVTAEGQVRSSSLSFFSFLDSHFFLGVFLQPV